MSKHTRKKIIICWMIFVFVFVVLYLLKPDFMKNTLESTFAVSNYLGIFIFLLAGCLRSFTLLPVTILIIAGLFFFTPPVLFVLIIITVFVSSTIAYYFSEYLHLDDSISPKYHKQVNWLKDKLTRYEFPLIAFISSSPIFPTDVLCYICGSLRINYWKFISGIIIGEGITCAIYIFLGGEAFNYILKYIHLI